MLKSHEMNSSNDQSHEAHEGASHGDPTKDRQLELEIQAFAELLLDIYEYRRKQKRQQATPRPAFDDGSAERKME